MVRGAAHAAVRLGCAGALGAVLVVAGCGGDDEGPAPTPVAVSGPLCAALPAGDDPGAPQTLVDESPAEALTWIPVVTTFEAATRGIELRDVTILAPSDDAFEAAFARRRLDDLLLSPAAERRRRLVDAHLIDGELSLADILEAGEVTTRAGTTLTVTEVDGQARLGDRARTVCADYDVAGARIHVIDGVLR
jgi:Fasciclin domain